MTQVNRTTLKSYFLTGNKPTEDQFANLIDSNLNFNEDSLTISDGKMSVGTNAIGLATLSVKGNLSVSNDTDIIPPGDGIYVGGQVHIGNSFTGTNADLAVDGGVYIGQTLGTDPGANNLQLDGDLTAGGDIQTGSGQSVIADEVRALGSSGLKLYEDSGSSGLLINDSGNVDIGGTADSHTLLVTGTFRATGNIDIGGKLSLEKTKYLETEEIRALDSFGLKLYEDSGTSGLFINDSGNVDIGGTADSHKLLVTGTFRATGDSSIGGNLTIDDTKYIETAEIRAINTHGLSLLNENGSGLSVGGNIVSGQAELVQIDGSFYVDGSSTFNASLTLSADKRVNADELRSVSGALSLYNSAGDGLHVNNDGELQFDTNAAMVSHAAEALAIQGSGSGSNSWQITELDTTLSTTDYHLVITGWNISNYNTFNYLPSEPVLKIVNSSGIWKIEPSVDIKGDNTLAGTVDYIAIRKEFFVSGTSSSSGVHSGISTQPLSS